MSADRQVTLEWSKKVEKKKKNLLSSGYTTFLSLVPKILAYKCISTNKSLSRQKNWGIYEGYDMTILQNQLLIWPKKKKKNHPLPLNNILIVSTQIEQKLLISGTV